MPLMPSTSSDIRDKIDFLLASVRSQILNKQPLTLPILTCGGDSRTVDLDPILDSNLPDTAGDTDDANTDAEKDTLASIKKARTQITRNNHIIVKHITFPPAASIGSLRSTLLSKRRRRSVSIFKNPLQISNKNESNCPGFSMLGSVAISQGEHIPRYNIQQGLFANTLSSSNHSTNSSNIVLETVTPHKSSTSNARLNSISSIAANPSQISHPDSCNQAHFSKSLNYDLDSIRCFDNDSSSTNLVVSGSRTNNSSRTFTILIFLLYRIRILLDTETVTTKRDLYYQNVPLFKTQKVVDRSIDVIAASLNVHRLQLNVVASPKSCVYGNISVVGTDGKVKELRNVIALKTY